MVVHFNVKAAVKVGINGAVILQYIGDCLVWSKANNTDYHNGHYWVQSSLKAFKKQFSYLGEKQIRNALNKLISEGLIMEGNFNASPFDRTLWYALTDKGADLLNGKEV